MALNLLTGDREQQFLMPPSVVDWLPEDHLAWTMIDAVEQFDLSAFYAGYRLDGRGGAVFDPQMITTLLLYAYAVGERSSRRIEQMCTQDVACRVVCANLAPDHTTISRFRQQHEQRLEQLFIESVRVCAGAGLVHVGTVAIDGRKIGADAAMDQNRTLDGLEREARRIFQEAAAADATEDARHGVGKRGDELPAELRGRRSRRAALARAKAELDAQQGAREAAHAEHLAQRAQIEIERGRGLQGVKPKPPQAKPDAKVNVTDPESRIVKSRRGYIQGYNAQAVVTEGQIVVAADVTQDPADFSQLHPMLASAERTLYEAGINDPIKAALADAGYASDTNFEEENPDGPELFVATQGRNYRDEPPPRGRIPNNISVYKRMHRKMLTKRGQAKYRMRSQTVEPVFGQHHTVQRFDRFSRRGHAAVDSEWKLVNAAHNLLKLHRAKIRANAQPA